MFISEHVEIKEFFFFWDGIQKSFYNILDILNDDDLKFTFNDDVLNVGELLTHVAKTHHSWLSNVVKDGEDSPEFTGSKEKINSVFDLKKALESGFARLNKFISNLNLEDWKKVDYTTEWKGKTYTESLKWILWHLIEHDIHHRAHIKM